MLKDAANNLTNGGLFPHPTTITFIIIRRFFQVILAVGVKLLLQNAHGAAI
jgi:hypothetical protein